MPTLLDSFVLELKLDPSQFTDSQKKAADALSQTEGQAERSAGRMEKAGGGVAAFFRSLEHPIAGLKRQFETLATGAAKPQRNLSDLAAQGRRTGANVESGALAGAAGLRVMGAAGLTAFATIAALDKLMGAAGESAKTVFGVGVGAGAAGLPIREFSAISQALLTHGNVPEEQTQGWLAEWRQWQLRLKTTGQGTERLAPLAQAGANLNPLVDTGEQALLKMARAFASLSKEEAIQRGSLAGLSAVQSLALRQNGRDLQQNIDLENRKHAIDASNNKAANDLIAAENRFGVAWNKLSLIFWNSVDPVLTAILDWITAIADLRFAPKESSALGTALDIIDPFGLVHKVAPAGGGTSAEIPVPAAPSSDGPTPPTATTGNWETRHNNFAGMRIPGVNAGPNSGGFQSFPSPEAGIQAIGRLLQSYQDRHGLNTLAGIISRWAPPNENNTASLIARASSVTGYGANQPLNLHDPAVLAKVTEAMIRGEQGGKLPVPGGAATIARALNPSAPSAAVSTASASTLSSTLNLVRQSAAAPSSIVHNYGDSNIGDVTIHTQATDGPGVVAAFKNETNWNSQASQANAGLE